MSVRAGVRGRSAAVVASVIVAGVVMSPSAAFAVLDPTQHGGGDAQGGYWYVAQQGVEEAHAAGFEGQGVKVAIIDSRINVGLPELAGANIKVHEPSYCMGEDGNPIPVTTTSFSASHGSSMAALVVGSGADGGMRGVAPKAEVLYYNAYVLPTDHGYSENLTAINACEYGEVRDRDAAGEAFAQAVADGADIISVSVGFNHSDVGDKALVEALRAGVIIVASFPNARETANSYFPLGGNGVFGAMSHDAAGGLRPNDKTGEMSSDELIDIVSPGVDILVRRPVGEDWSSTYLASGNSGATALTAGLIAVVMSKYPDATPHQIIQSVLRNTDQGDGELVRDSEARSGYGKFDLGRVLAQDPKQYPDENPLLTKEPAVYPKYEEVMGTDPVPDDDATDSPVTPAPEKASSSIIVWAAIGFLAMVAIVGITVGIVMSRRKRAATAQQYSPGWQYPSDPYSAQQPQPHMGQPQSAEGQQQPLPYPPLAPGQQMNPQNPWSQPPNTERR